MLYLRSHHVLAGGLYIHELTLEHKTRIFFQLTNDIDMVLSSVTTLMEACGFTKLISQPIGEKLLPPPQAMVCPGSCTGNGNCEAGVCTCLPGFEGVDCSVNQKETPTVKEIIG